MSLMKKKYNKLVKELIYINSEYKYVKDIVLDAHREFEIYYQNYCVENQVPLQELNKSNKEKLKKVFPKKVQEVDEEGIVKSAKSDTNAKPVDKSLQKMYRAVAQKIHPDKFANSESTEEVQKKTEMFKEITTAYNERDWGSFLNICDKLDIFPTRYIKVIEVIRKEIAEVNKKIDREKLSFSWRLLECDEDKKCKDNVIKSFLFQLFKYK